MWGLRDVATCATARSSSRSARTPPPPSSLWTECTRRAPAPLDAAPATLLAVSAWLRGDGAMANVALDAGARQRPGLRARRLLREALAACVPPGPAALDASPTAAADGALPGA